MTTHAEAVRNACIAAALAGYEDAAISGLCHEGAWEAALSAIRGLDLGALAEAAVPKARGTIDAAAASTGAIAAALLERAAALSTLHGPEGFRKRAHAIASRAATLQSALRTALHVAATDALDIAARCAQMTTLAAEVATTGGPEEARHDAEAALRLAASAAECALALTERNLGSAVESDSTRSAQRRIWRTRLLLRRARPATEDENPMASS
jgi:hypothetical protein